MPKISGRDILSEATEKSQGRLLLVSAIAIVSKAYQLPVSEIEVLGMQFPGAIFDVSFLILVSWYTYSYLIKWSGDLLGFRLWYSESSVWSNFGTNMKLDKTFINGGIKALIAFNELNITNMTAAELANIPDDKKKLYDEFRTNSQLYASRLEWAGKKFTTISAFGHFYVWFQGLMLPIVAAILAIYFLLKYGTYYAPPQY